MRTDERTLPRWDLTSVFPALDSDALTDELGGAYAALDELAATFDRLGIGADAGPHSHVAAAFDEVTEGYNALSERVRTLYAYLACLVSADATDDDAQGRLSELQTRLVTLDKLRTRYEAWIGTWDLDGLLDTSELAREHAFALRRAQISARHQMSDAEEDLAASLNPSGPVAWTKLHGNVTSRIVVGVELPDGRQEMPMSAVRGLAHDADADVRRAAYTAELEAWERHAVPLAAAMNGIKGAHGVLNARRGWTDALGPSLHTNNVDRGTLDAMQSACVASFGDFRRYLRAKARLLGSERLPWPDLFAPVGGEVGSWGYDDATSFVVERFGGYSDGLAGLAERAFRDGWIDAEPREGKRDGAFCIQMRPGESRVLCNFTGTFSSVSTIAHELGHAYHNLQLADRTPLQRDTPMALAETASIFCQTIVMNALLADASGAEELALLEGELEHACQIVVDIHSRFLFERAVFERRSERELSVGELNDLMLDAQGQTYGDGLDPDSLHPYMWAVKPHYYSRAFYNWPYTFGFLFGLGLYARYQQDPESFRDGYDDLLSSTGLEDAATLARRFDVDISDEAFWRSSLDVVRGRIDRFESLADT